MNHTPSARPRLICRAFRLWQAIDGGPHADATTSVGARHLETCVACQQYFQACGDLENALRRDASAQKTEIPVGLERRIMQSVVSNSRPPRPARAPMHWILVGGGATLVALALFSLYRPSDRERSQSWAGQIAQVQDVVVVAQSLSGFVRGSLIPSAQTLATNNPLQQELDAVYSDARSALDFLAVNFLPAGALTPAHPSPGASSPLGS